MSNCSLGLPGGRGTMRSAEVSRYSVSPLDRGGRARTSSPSEKRDDREAATIPTHSWIESPGSSGKVNCGNDPVK